MLVKWFAPILSFTTEEIFTLVNKENNKDSIHLQRFVEIPDSWLDESLSSRWKIIKKIRDEANVSIETKRASKELGSSLEAKIAIKLNKELYQVAKDEDFSEICITSESNVIQDEQTEKEIEVTTKKATGNKCSLCWKVKSKKCERENCKIL